MKETYYFKPRQPSALADQSCSCQLFLQVFIGIKTNVLLNNAEVLMKVLATFFFFF